MIGYLSKKAFTLAEVLITIGIIGVVSAMVIPTLVTNVRGAQYRNQFKKTFSALKQAGKMSEAHFDFGYVNLPNMTCDNPANDNPASHLTICAIANYVFTGSAYWGMGNTVKVADGTNYTVTPAENSAHNLWDNMSNYYIYSLADGAILGISKTEGKASFIDVNGLTGPNREVTCADDEETNDIWFGESVQDCNVPTDKKHFADVYPIYIRTTGIPEPVPATNAAKSVLGDLNKLK